MEIAQRLRPAVVAILNGGGDVSGTGFFITSQGHILTCYHVIEGLLIGNKVKIRTADGKTFLAAFEAENPALISRWTLPSSK